jgi:hypothetical protein
LGNHNCKVKDFVKTEKKRCKDCFRIYINGKKDEANKIREENKNKNTEEDKVLLDTEETDFTSKDWQGGKHAGSVFPKPLVTVFTNDAIEKITNETWYKQKYTKYFPGERQVLGDVEYCC